MQQQSSELKKILKPIHLWAIGVGLVISGEYFGWNYGWAVSGTVGLLCATLVISILYFTFIFSFTELTTAIPKAGGPFSYSLEAFGPLGAVVAGYATVIEFVFATPAIAVALGSYLHFLHPQLPVMPAAITSYLIFTFINLLGIKEAAWFSLLTTILAVLELLLFLGVVIPHFRMDTFLYKSMPFGYGGIFAALPFAIWLFVCLEGVAMVAEEVKDGRSIAKGYISALFTLTILAIATMVTIGGLAHWDKLDNLDYPLPESISLVLGKASFLTNVFASVGLFGLIASFHGIIISYSRQLFALSREGYLPRSLAKLSPGRDVPYWSLFTGAGIGISAMIFLNTSDLVILSTIGAAVVYIISMLSLFKLRFTRPDLPRPYKAPLYPYFPSVALILSFLTLSSMIYFYPRLSMIFFAGLVLVISAYYLFKGRKTEVTAEEELNPDHYGI